MSAFTGPQGKGAMRQRRAVKREQAKARNDCTRVEQTRQWRLRDEFAVARDPEGEWVQ